MNLDEFIPIKTFRAAHHLPESFGVAYFEPKDYTGLGSIEHRGAELHHLRRAVLESIPVNMTPAQWMNFLPTLQKTFHRELVASDTGLRDVEVDFAVAGLENVCRAMIYARIQADATKQPPPAFEQIYNDWLQSTVRISQAVYEYGQWRVQMINHAYGRIGLMIQADSQIWYVRDHRLACPAEGFMLELLHEIAKMIL